MKNEAFRVADRREAMPDAVRYLHQSWPVVAGNQLHQSAAGRRIGTIVEQDDTQQTRYCRHVVDLPAMPIISFSLAITRLDIGHLSIAAAR